MLTLQNGKRGSGWSRKTEGSNRFFILFLEREPLLSSFPAYSTVGSLWDKKESCSTRRGVRVGTDLGSFLKLRKVGVSPYLGFILYLSTLLMFELIEAVRGRLIGPKT